MDPKELIDQHGGAREIAEKLGIPVRNVRMWRYRGIPRQFALRMSVITGEPVAKIRPDMAA